MAVPPTKLSTVALLALGQFPPSIQDTLVSDPTFRNSYGITADARVSLGEDQVSFLRSKLLDCARRLLGEGSAEITLIDEAGEEWVFEVVEIDNRRRVGMSRGERRFVLPDFYALSPDEKERISRFEKDADEVNLPESVACEWRQTLASRSLLDSELDLFSREINKTPIRVASLIATEIETGTGQVSTLVPRSERYYERLVGKYQQSGDITDYAQTGAKKHIGQLLSWRASDGFSLSLLLSSHSSIPSAIESEQHNESGFLPVYESLRTQGDRISQIGAIEIGLRICDKVPAIVPYVKAMIEDIRDDDPEDEHGRFHLLYSLIMLVDGELSRTKILRTKPPFWRRLASIAQASLNERCIIKSRVEIGQFSEWASRARAHQFYLQTLADLRQEPRWLPDYAAPSQLKAEFLSRIMTAGQRNIDKIHDPDLKELLLGEGPNSLPSMVAFQFAYPGPLEGGLEAQIEAPPQYLSAIEEQLSAEILGPTSFAALVNAALVFRLASHHAELAAKAVRSAKYQLRHVDNDEQLFNALRGVAIVAAVTRSGELAEELRILVRRCRREPGRGLPVEEATVIGLMAAAAYPQLDRWSQFVGEWITELAFDLSDRSDMNKLLSDVQLLCRIAPELWFSCGRAEAALSAS